MRTRRRPPRRAVGRLLAPTLVLAVLSLAATTNVVALGPGAGAETPRDLAHGASARLVATPQFTPTITATPNKASAPTSITVSGASFDPAGSSVTCHFTSGTPASSATFVPAPTGSVSGTLRLTAADAVGTNPIVCTQTSQSQALTATAPFTVTTLMPTCSLTATPTCAVGQVVGATVTGTDLTSQDALNATPNASGGVNPTATTVALSSVTLGNETTSPACRTLHASAICSTDGFVASNGHLNSIVVEDDRGDLAGWTATGQLTSNFEGPTVGHDHSIPADFLTWLPSIGPASTSCVTLATVHSCGPSDVLSEISPGPSHSLSSSTAAILCQAAPGGGGGGTKCTAKLVLAIPPYIEAGQYSTSIEIVVS